MKFAAIFVAGLVVYGAGIPVMVLVSQSAGVAMIIVGAVAVIGCGWIVCMENMDGRRERQH